MKLLVILLSLIPAFVSGQCREIANVSIGIPTERTDGSPLPYDEIAATGIVRDIDGRLSETSLQYGITSYNEQNPRPNCEAGEVIYSVYVVDVFGNLSGVSIPWVATFEGGKVQVEPAPMEVNVGGDISVVPDLPLPFCPSSPPYDFSCQFQSGETAEVN